MNTKLREERGGVMVLAAILIPVFLVMTALVVETGNWFTHDRQLQNRADAGAFAAGVEYAKNWKACVQTADLALKRRTGLEIANAARQYAGNPETADYTDLDPSGVVPVSLYNDNIARQSANQAQNKLDVVINSTTYADDTDYTDDYDGTADSDADGREPDGNPCFLHRATNAVPNDPDLDYISPYGGHWTDVRVRERDTGALWKAFSPDVSARARIEIRPGISARNFLPLAIPDNIITQVQVRYIDECTGDELARQNLAPLPETEYAAYSSSGGGVLWGMENANPTITDGDKNRSFDLPIRAFDAADCNNGQDYRAVIEEVRLASSDEVDLDTTDCDDLKDSSFADCFQRLSTIRSWNDGNANNQPRIRDVKILGGCGGPSDAYFGVPPAGQTSCEFDVSVQVDWGTRDTPNLNVPGNFTVSVGGTALTLGAWDTSPGGVATYSSSGGAFTRTYGAWNVPVTIRWRDTDRNHVWEGQACTNSASNTPCQYGPATEVVHQTVVGKDSQSTKTSGPASDPTATGAVEFVHTSRDTLDGAGAPGSSFDNWAPDHAACTTSPCSVYPLVGTRSVLRTGMLTTLRIEEEQGSQLLDCDPDFGQVLLEFKFGCQPWYGKNTFQTTPPPNWWVPAAPPDEGQCPDKNVWWDQSTGPYKNSSGSPYRCVLQQPGGKNGQSGDWFAVATENCDRDNGTTQCQDFTPAARANCGNYDGVDSNGNGVIDPAEEGWLQAGGDSRDPRVVSLFIVPYQAFKNIGGSGSNGTLPVIGFANFYIMNWQAQQPRESDPCPDPTFGTATVDPPGDGNALGVFVEAVDYEPGPVDPTATCSEGRLEVCRAVLVR